MTADATSTHPPMPADWADDGWWACTEPERPPDGLTAYDELCQWCVVKARIDLTLGADTPREWWNPDTGERGIMRLSEWLAVYG